MESDGIDVGNQNPVRNLGINDESDECAMTKIYDEEGTEPATKKRTLVDIETNEHASKRRCEGAVLPTKSQFVDFLLVKSYDIISENKYRKYLVGCKENGDAWAISLQNSISIVVASGKHVHTKVEAISNQIEPKLKKMCQEVMSMPDAPTTRSLSWATCFITGMKCDGCVEIGSHLKSNTRHKNKQHNDSPEPPKPRLPLTVHPKFAHFAFMLWYVSRIEHIIRNYTRYWITHNKQEILVDLDLATKCNLFAQQEDLFENLYSAYTHAFSHVIASLDNHV
jgi:hypothetical protein